MCSISVTGGAGTIAPSLHQAWRAVFTASSVAVVVHQMDHAALQKMATGSRARARDDKFQAARL